MSEMSARPPPGPSRMEGPAGVLRISMLLVLSAASVSANPQLQIRKGGPPVNAPRYYCAADVKSLGTGLSRAPMTSSKELPPRGVSRWTG